MITTLKEYTEKLSRLKGDLGPRRLLLFRGQISSSWNLKSSLERHGVNQITCGEYYRLIDRYKPLINPFIENKYERKSSLAGYPFNFQEYDKGSWELPEMEYLAYLRHHGFPTPLLDFSLSCFVALFFACEDFNTEEKLDGKVFLYSPPENKENCGNGIPDVRIIGRYVEAGKRHFAQQSQYLVSVNFDSEWKFITFQEAVEHSRNDHVLREIIIEAAAKASLMSSLREMNINRYSMFLNEDALIRAFADELALERNYSMHNE